MKILGENKLLLNEDDLPLNEKQGGEEYEIASAAYLNGEFSPEDNVEFEHQGGNNNKVSDILVKKDDKGVFYIECKDTKRDAQGGEFGVKLVDGKLTVGRTHSQDTAEAIVDIINSNIDVESIGTGGYSLMKLPGIIPLFEERIYDIYKNEKNTEYIMAAGNIRYNIASIEDWTKLLKIKNITLRWKANNSSSISGIRTKVLIPFLEKEFNATNIQLIGDKSSKKLLFDSENDISNYTEFTADDGNKYIITVIKDRSGSYENTTQKYQVRTPGGRGIIIAELGINDPSVNEIDKLKKDLGVKEDLNMNKNLSEELIINDNISLGKDDEEQAKEIEKSAEEHEKEVNKELADKVKDVKEINEFEVKPIKGLSEKLTLEEPSDVLTEDFEDELNDDIFILADNITNLLKSFMRTHPEVPDRDSVFEDAFNIAMNNIIKVNEEVLDEKIPADLAKAYKKANYSGRSGANTDLQNADYQEVDANTGYKLYKEDPKQVRLLVNGKLIDFRDNGYPSLDHRDEWLPDNLAYVKKNGQKIKDTLHVPAKHLFSIASKIYVTNEHKPEGQKDQDLLSKRRENPESRYGSVSDLKSRSVASKYWGDPEIRGNVDLMNTSSYKRQRIDRYKKELKQYQEYIRNATSDSDKRYYQQRIDKLNDSIKELQGDIDDAEARKRYANSERSLQKPLERYISLKSNINNLQDRVDRSQRELEQVRTNGSDESRRNKQRLTELQQRLKELRKQIAMVELDLEGTDEEDARAVAAAEAKYQAAMGQLGDAQAEINALLRRG